MPGELQFMGLQGEGHNLATEQHHHLRLIILHVNSVQFSSVAQSGPNLGPHGLQHTRLPCPSPAPRACSNSCPSSQWYHPTVSSYVIPFSSFHQSFPTAGSFQMSQFLTSGGQSIGASALALVLPVNIQGRFISKVKMYFFLISEVYFLVLKCLEIFR